VKAVKRVVLGFLIVTAGVAHAQSVRRTQVVQVVEKVRPAVVNLTARQVATVRRRSLFDNLFPELAPPGSQVYTSQSLGSGVVVSSDGLLITNEHVIEGAAEITVRFASGKEVEAKVIGSDADTDLALLQIPGKGYPFLPLAEGDDSFIGETVIAIGNPLGLENTVTVGVLSARDRTVQSPNTHRVYTDFLQTDASINPGNSGGALVDLDSRLIGINTAIIGDAQGIGFAIPARRVRRVVGDLQRYGQVQPAWLGLFVTNRSEGRGQDRQNGAGVQVVEVFPGSPAAAAGLGRGIVLLGGNGRTFASRDDYLTVLAQVGAGERITLQVATDAGPRDVALRAASLPPDLGQQLLATFVGIRIAVRRQGVAVDRVLAGGPAEEAGMAVGDVILQVNGEPVESLADVNRILGRDHMRSSVLLVIQRGRYAYQLPFRLAP
jgi:serine protease Do